jgi:hypothetical protein
MEAIMQEVTIIGIDLGKHSFHVHGQDRHGKALLRKKFSRKQLIESSPSSMPAQSSWKPVPALIRLEHALALMYYATHGHQTESRARRTAPLRQ